MSSSIPRSQLRSFSLGQPEKRRTGHDSNATMKTRMAKELDEHYATWMLEEVR
jgi:hypothetical protein